MHEQTLTFSVKTNSASCINDALRACIEACGDCESACVACAAACLDEKDVSSITSCIRLDLDCADICASTARVAARSLPSNVDITRAQLELCAKACAACERECRKHTSHMDHCRLCANACKHCEAACVAALGKQPTQA